MSIPETVVPSRRILLLPPTARDAEITERVLRERNIETLVCDNVAHVCREATVGAGTLLIAEEHLARDSDGCVARFLHEQPAWSDLPLLILTLASPHDTSVIDWWQRAANVTLISRPLSLQSFISVVESRLRDRERQYTVYGLLNSLKTSGRKFRQLADAMPQMVFSGNARGRIEYVNERAIKTLGVPDDATAEFDWVSVIDPQDVESAAAGWKRALETGSPFQAEFRVRDHQTSEYHWHLARAVPIRDPDGAVVSWFGTGTDIHDQKLVEEKLNIARDQAAAASIVKSEFLANMSHEIRTPMTSILGYAEILAGMEPDPEKLGFLNVIRRNGEFLLEIINDILDLSKIEAGKLEIETAAIDIREMISEIRSLMRFRALEKGIEFDVEFTEPVPNVIQSDPKRLRQILVNLVGNAVKFTERGNVRIIVRHDVVRGLVVFEVRDTGIGMNADQIRNLFQPFQQGDASVSRQFGGTGLGLAITRRLVNVLGGEIDVVSEPGHGSTFVCSISTGSLSSDEPLPEQHEGSGSIRNPKRFGRTLACRILVVDDRRDIRFLIGRILTSAGAEVRYAENGAEATNAMKELLDAENAPDLVLMDMQMPVMDGFEATSQLRQMGFQKPIIALTADAMQGDMDRCISSGCNAYLSKPIDAAELVDTVSVHTTN